MFGSSVTSAPCKLWGFPDTGIQDTGGWSSAFWAAVEGVFAMPAHPASPACCCRRAPGHSQSCIRAGMGWPLLLGRILCPSFAAACASPARCQAHGGEWCNPGEAQLVCLRACRALAELPRINQHLLLAPGRVWGVLVAPRCPRLGSADSSAPCHCCHCRAPGVS